MKLGIYSQLMKKLSVTDLKSQFSFVIYDLKQGKKVQIIYGCDKVPLATIVPQSQLTEPNYSIPLGDLQKQDWTYKMNDYALHGFKVA